MTAMWASTSRASASSNLGVKGVVRRPTAHTGKGGVLTVYVYVTCLVPCNVNQVARKLSSQNVRCRAHWAASSLPVTLSAGLGVRFPAVLCALLTWGCGGVAACCCAGGGGPAAADMKQTSGGACKAVNRRHADASCTTVQSWQYYCAIAKQ
jgi:hypothetical protein